MTAPAPDSRGSNIANGPLPPWHRDWQLQAAREVSTTCWGLT